METIVNFFRSIFDSGYRKQEWESELHFVENEIKVLGKEIISIQKILPLSDTHRGDMKDDVLLLAYYEEKKKVLMKKLDIKEEK